MISLYKYNIDTNTADFVVDESSEIDSLPTTSTGGQDGISWVKPVGQGSTVFVINDSAAYMLGGDGWQEI